METIRSKNVRQLISLLSEFAESDANLKNLAKNISEKGFSKRTAYDYAHAIQTIKEVSKLSKPSQKTPIKTCLEGLGILISDNISEELAFEIINETMKTANFLSYDLPSKEQKLKKLSDLIEFLKRRLIDKAEF